jgi:hypothetical protein
METLEELRAGPAARGVAAVPAVGAFRKAMSSFPTGVILPRLSLMDEGSRQRTADPQSQSIQLPREPMLQRCCVSIHQGPPAANIKLKPCIGTACLNDELPASSRIAYL